MAEVEEGEGFFCPLCKQDLHSFRQLDVHFREEHDESRGNKLKHNIRNIFDKAKALRKPKPRAAVEDGASAVARGSSLRDDSVELDLDEPVTNVSGIASYWPPQEFGACTDYTSVFKRDRDAHISGIVVETNRLVIRLENFIVDHSLEAFVELFGVNRFQTLFRNLKASSPKTTRQMKAVEQTIVPWKKDSDEKHCMSCGRKFGPQRRKHHCRLCGGIMCKQCSQFMTHTELYPVICECPDYGKLCPRTTVHTRRIQMKSHALGSAKSQAKKEEEEAIDELRLCNSCCKLIHRKLVHMEGQEKPVIVALYENMKLTMDEAERVKPGYIEMAESLLSGEHTYTLNQASKKRQELVRLYESVDSISKRIMGLGGSDITTRNYKLSRSVRVYASNYLQENLLLLPSLPTVAQLRGIREQVEKEAQERLRELEREREKKRKHEEEVAAKASAKALEEKKGIDKFLDFSKEISTKMSDTFKRDGEGEKKGFDRLLDFSKELSTKMSVTFKRDSEAVAVEPDRARSSSESGWMCSTNMSASVDSTEDPFDLQKKQLLLYIKQARDANRMDEVRALEASLREIEATIIEQKKLSYGL